MSCYEILGVPESISVEDIHKVFHNCTEKNTEMFSAYSLALELAMYNKHSFDVAVDIKPYVAKYINFKHSFNSIKDLKDLEDI
jgi:hypothetical protein